MRWSADRFISKRAAPSGGRCPGGPITRPATTSIRPSIPVGISTRWPTPELRFALVSGGDTLYGATIPTEDDPITGVFTVDPVTGQPADRYITAFEVEDWDRYMPSSWQNVVIPDGMAYWAGFLEGRNTHSVDILAASLEDPDDFTTYEFDMPASGSTRPSTPTAATCRSNPSTKGETGHCWSPTQLLKPRDSPTPDSWSSMRNCSTSKARKLELELPNIGRDGQLGPG